MLRYFPNHPVSCSSRYSSIAQSILAASPLLSPSSMEPEPDSTATERRFATDWLAQAGTASAPKVASAASSGRSSRSSITATSARVTVAAGENRT